MARSAKDITGERFGKLVVTGFAGYGQEGRQQVALWNCRCDCGNTCTVRGYLLKSGRRKSCGCIRSLPEQMIGERFGRLTVTGPDTRNQSSLQKVICRCDCGTVKSIPTRYLKNGRVTDCGCGRREVPRQKDQADLERDARLETVKEAFCGGNLRAAETLEEWAYIWVRCLLPPVVKASTVCMYAETMERHILPYLGKKKLGELTEAAVSQWVDILQKTDVPDTQNGRMTEGTVRNTLSVLSGCLRDAQKYRLMAENPCTVSAWTVRTKNVWDETDRLTDEKLAVLGPRLFSYRGEDGYPLGLAFQLLLYTGIALSEAAALRWEEVDFPEGELHLNYFVAQRRGQSAPGARGTELFPGAADRKEEKDGAGAGFSDGETAKDPGRISGGTGRIRPVQIQQKAGADGSDEVGADAPGACLRPGERDAQDAQGQLRHTGRTERSQLRHGGGTYGICLAPAGDPQIHAPGGDG